MLYMNESTKPEIRTILSNLCGKNIRVRIWYGSNSTGESYNEEYNVMGYIGKSAGTQPIPLLIKKSNSIGGGAILTSSIVRIDNINTKRTLYKHPKFSTGLSQKGSQVFKDGEVYANLKNEDKAIKYIQFMNGERYSK